MTVETILEEVADDTHRLEVRLSDARYIFSVYLLPGKEPVLIEPGPACVVPFILQGMEKVGIQQLSYIIPTHIHMDHGGGTGNLAKRFPQAKVLIHPRGVRHAIDPSRLIAATKIVYGKDFEEIYGPILPLQESQIQTAEDGDVIHAGGRELRIIHAPGHAAHHLAILDGKTRGIFCGEALGFPTPGAESDILPAVSVGDLDVGAYLASIEKLRGLQPKMLFYPHDGGARIPGDALSRIAKNTAALRDIILEDLKSDRSTKEIEQHIQERVLDHPGAKTRPPDTEGVISGYTAYFRKKGLI